MNKLPVSQNTTPITLWFYSGRRSIDAFIVSPRIAVHQRMTPAGRIEADHWMVSDPVTGLSWIHNHFQMLDRETAVRYAKAIKRNFGANPLRGGILDHDGGWKRKPANWQRISAYCRKPIRGAR